jgi:FkbM family methyltransferase
VISEAIRKTLARVPPLAALVKSRPLQHLVQTLRGAKAVREPLRFMALQFEPARAATPPRAAAHRLREADLTVFLRHRTRDVHIFNEIFGGTGGRRSYEPPPAIAAMLDATAAPAILDLGANIGLFGAYAMSRWPGAQIRSFEPDPTNLSMLARVIAANGLERRWSVADVAVANHGGEMGFSAGLFADSHLELAANPRTSIAGPPARQQGHTITVKTVDIFEQDHHVDLIKIDIEGGEWAILTDPRLAALGADVLVLEWHARGCPEPDAAASTLRLLRAAGYRHVQEIERSPNNGLLWAWRENGGAAASRKPRACTPERRAYASSRPAGRARVDVGAAIRAIVRPYRPSTRTP